MALLFIRHAVALRRRDWTKPDALRPLSPRGYRQADGLPDALARFEVTRILSSPSTRCLETVQPLAARLGIPVEERAELAEGAGTAALALLGGLDGTAVLCSHGDVVPELLAEVVGPGVLPPGELPCEKGSTWAVEEARTRATYLPPPA
jgi:8-oxo-(d)GTP phosphatase